VQWLNCGINAADFAHYEPNRLEEIASRTKAQNGKCDKDIYEHRDHVNHE
jgi:hypothetical protein